MLYSSIRCLDMKRLPMRAEAFPIEEKTAKVTLKIQYNNWVFGIISIFGIIWIHLGLYGFIWDFWDFWDFRWIFKDEKSPESSQSAVSPLVFLFYVFEDAVWLIDIAISTQRNANLAQQ